MKNFADVRDYLLNNEEALLSIVRDINSYNGSLEHLDFYENDEEFFEMFFHNNPMEAVRASFYGHYNYSDDYVRFNGYGNLESFNEWGIIEECKGYIDDIVNELDNCWEALYIYDDELLKLLEEEEEEEEE